MGGLVEFTEGTFNTDGSIDVDSDIALVGRGPRAIIQKNSTDYAIDIQGTTGTYKENIILRDFKVTRSTGDTNDVPLVHMQYARNVIMDNVVIDDSAGDGVVVENCENIKLQRCIINGSEVNGVIFKQTLQAALLACTITASGGIGCRLLTDEITDIIDRGDCESTTAPMITPETVPVTSNCTWARSNEQAYEGTYSYKYTITSGVSASYISFTDTVGAGDLHGFVPGKTYRFLLKTYIPTGTDASLLYYRVTHSAPLPIPWVQPKAIYDEWQEIEIIFTIPLDATTCFLWIESHGGQDDNDYLYVDDVKVYESVPENNGYIVDNTTIKENEDDGLYIATNQARITNSLIEDNHDIGINILAGKQNYIFSNAARDNGNVLIYDKCENAANTPHIESDGSTFIASTASRSTEQFRNGDYSLKIKRTTGSTIESEYLFCDNDNENDLHELEAGYSYNLMGYSYLLATGSPTTAEVTFIIGYTTDTTTGSAWNETTGNISTDKDSWQSFETGEVLIPSYAESAKVLIRFSTGASTDEVLYVDDLRLKPIGIHNEHEQNFVDNGEETQYGQNSWQAILI